MNRVSLTFNERGEITRICSDERLEFHWVFPNAPQGQAHLRPNIDVGRQHVREEIGGVAKAPMTAEDEKAMEDILAKGRAIIMAGFAEERA
ncbi:hypothetical protein [Azospirillum sp. TSO22-1]|uniref:hypothetical protein n=1 Tax=Azospirillum sp. TSO22-1 TaxID=716789 RepID=UPI000D6212B3|nr:hypothetical protein [Azospirillum sp. TSO22-1]PWC45759.1 hypothetical protein TSO221_15825 [Azospirillum sp. TSO22-1]